MRLPVFPLSLVLFPGTPLPLHIFEPRYRQMLTDCLAGDRRFGITPAGTDQEAPARVDLLRETFSRYAALMRELSDVEPRAPELPDEPLPLSFHVAAAVDVETPVKQQLLVERSTARRVEALLVVLAAVTAGLERALEVHRRAHTNGRGYRIPPMPAT